MEGQGPRAYQIQGLGSAVNFPCTVWIRASAEYDFGHFWPLVRRIIHYCRANLIFTEVNLVEVLEEICLACQMGSSFWATPPL